MPSGWEGRLGRHFGSQEHLYVSGVILPVGGVINIGNDAAGEPKERAWEQSKP